MDAQRVRVSSSASDPRGPSSGVACVGRDLFDNSRGSFQKTAPSSASEAATGAQGKARMEALQAEGRCRCVQGAVTTCAMQGCRRKRAADVSCGLRNNTNGPLCSERKATHELPSRAARCEYPGCSRTPRYGATEVHMSFCQAHKRIGMYTARNGQVLMATRDGNAFRTAADSSASVNFSVSEPALPAAPHTTADFVGANFPVVAAAAAGVPAGREPLSPGLVEMDAETETNTRPLPLKETLNTRPLPLKETLPDTDEAQFRKRRKLKDATSKTKARWCLFPGCSIRPRYGLPKGGRPVYCVTHKKGNMVHVNPIKEGCVKNAEENADDTATSDGATAARQSEGIEGGGGSDGDVFGAAAAAAAADTAAADQLPAALSPLPGLSPSSVEKREPSTTPVTTEPSTAANATTDPPKATSPPVPHRSKNPPKPATYNMSPSEEMRIVKEARAAARAEAEAKGGGRRARVPSRRLLESSGKITGVGVVQWMTAEQKVVEKRRKQMLREQRLRSMTVGLGPGLVLETYVVPASVGSAGEVTDGGEGGGGEGGAEETGGASNSERPVSLQLLPHAMVDRQGRNNSKGRPKPAAGGGSGGDGSANGSGGGGGGVSDASSPGVGRKRQKGEKGVVAATAGLQVGVAAGKGSFSSFSDSNPSRGRGVHVKIEILDSSDDEGEQEQEKVQERRKQQEKEQERKEKEQAQENEQTQAQEQERENKQEQEPEKETAAGGSTTGEVSNLPSAVACSSAADEEQRGGVSAEGERPSKRAKQTENAACRGGVDVEPTTAEAERKAEDQASKKECHAKGEEEGEGAVGKATKDAGKADSASACELGRCEKASTFGVNGATQSCKAHRVADNVQKASDNE